jgi:hypothetical protein
MPSFPHRLRGWDPSGPERYRAFPKIQGWPLPVIAEADREKLTNSVELDNSHEITGRAIVTRPCTFGS